LLPALARVCAVRGSKLTYHTLPLPERLAREETSYLAMALSTGCLELVEHENTASFNAYRTKAAGDHVVRQGGQWAAAEPGMVALAEAIGTWWKTRPGGGLDVPRAKGVRGLDVVLPADSGTAALFLARHAPPDVRIYAVPCNGNEESLRARMKFLDDRSGATGTFPRVLLPPESHTVPFGKVSKNLLAAWRDAINSGCFLDLNYGPVAWAAMDARKWQLSDMDESERDLLYINTGGHECLRFQLGRYLRAGFLNRYDVQRKKERHMSPRGDKWYAGQWGVEEILSEARRVAMAESGLVHTRDAGL